MNKSFKIIFASLTVFCISMIIYSFTLCPAVYLGDSGELAAAAYNLGIPHPPGYPLYCLCCKLFMFIPLSSIAYRMNAMSSFCAAAAALVLFLAMVKIRLRPLMSGIAAICFILSRTLWETAGAGEVYTLHNFLAAALIYLAALFWCSKKTGYLYLMALISGIALSNHQTIALLGPGLAFAIWASDRKIRLRFNIVANMLLLGFLGTLVYLYLPVRASAHPAINWGNTQTWPDFIAHILRKGYGSLGSGHRELGQLLKHGRAYTVLLWSQFTPYLLVFVLPGLWQLWRKNRLWLITTFLFFVFPSFGLIYIIDVGYTPHDLFLVESFYIVSYLAVALWIGFGLDCLTELAKLRYAQYAFLLLPVLPLTFNFYEADKSRNYIGLDFALNMLKTVEPNGTLSAGTSDNEAFTLAYATMVGQRRQDITVFGDNGTVYPDIYNTNLFRLNQPELQSYRDSVQRDLIKKSPGPVYCILNSYLANAGLQKVPAGILFRIVRQGETPSRHNYWKDYEMRSVYDDSIFKDFYANHVVSMYHIYLGAQYLKDGRKKEGLRELACASGVGSEIEWIHNNLGIIYAENGYLDEAISEYQQAIRADSSVHAAYENICLAGSEKIKRCQLSGNAEKLLSAQNKAIGFYQQLVQIEPSNVAAHYNLGVLYAHTGNIDRSITELSKTVQLNPHVDAFHLDLATALQIKGLFEPACREFKEALRCNPNNIDAQRRLSQLEAKPH